MLIVIEVDFKVSDLNSQLIHGMTVGPTSAGVVVRLVDCMCI